MENFEELEHNPFADAVSPHSQQPSPATTNNTTTTKDKGTVLVEQNLQSLSVANNDNDNKERTSSVLNSKTPVEVDIPHHYDDFNITVHDPQTVGDGLKAHTTYSITTKVSL